MTFARRTFFWAGLYGLLAVLPQYFMEGVIAHDFPPPVTHPEHFYGFLGLAVAWQVAFFVIARDPVRFRPFMLLGALEKLLFGGAAVVLHLQGRLATVVFAGGLFDLVLAALFVLAWRLTPTSPR